MQVPRSFIQLARFCAVNQTRFYGPDVSTEGRRCGVIKYGDFCRVVKGLDFFTAIDFDEIKLGER